ncbi:MAG: HAD family hydrolase [Litorimonas sp.]
MARKQINAAIIYDFDGTLSPINMQEHEFIPKLGMDHEKFWAKTKTMAKENNASEILCYMYLMLREAGNQNIPIGRQSISDYGKNMELFEGVETWFDRTNKYAKSKGVKLSHYVISSGIKSLIEGTSIGKHFTKIFACDYIYDSDGKPVSPGVAVDYTAKTQYIFRINKGCEDQWDDRMINEHVSMENRPIPIENMIYIGDGPTDIPAMKMTSHYGGLSICVYKPNTPKKKARAYQLLNENRADCVARADYRAGKYLDEVVSARIDHISAAKIFEKIKKKQLKS